MSNDNPPSAAAAPKYFAPRRLAHVNLWVDDVDRSQAFYQDVCGLMVEFTEPDILATFMGVGHTQHDLGMMQTTRGENRYGRDGILQIPGHVGRHVGLNHIAWEVENEAELVQAFRNLRANGAEVDVTMDHQIAHSIYLFDPDGNYNEFYCDTTPDWRSVLNGEMGLITGRWDPDMAEGFTDPRYPTDSQPRTYGPAPLHAKRITHLVLQTANMREMRRFYTVVGGMQVVREAGPAVYLRGSLDAYRFGLVLIDAAESHYAHASFELGSEDAFEQSLADLQARHVPVERVVSLPWKRSLFLRDPDGLMSEWYVPRQGERDPSSAAGEQMPFAV